MEDFMCKERKLSKCVSDACKGVLGVSPNKVASRFLSGVFV